MFPEKDPLVRIARILDAIDESTAYTGAGGRPVNPVDVDQLFEVQYYLREAIAALADELRLQRRASVARDPAPTPDLDARDELYEAPAP